MYECLNCAANLKFDIATQKMLCEHCGTTMDPYDLEEKQDATESVMGDDEYEVTIFTCPQCGGELLSNDTTAATFCSYCGGSTILSSRISKEKRPQFIIPFRKTREECRSAYGKMIKRSFFVPREMRDEDFISRFRSIYMPYWVYTFEKSGHVSFKGIRRVYHENASYTYIYNMESDIEAKYKGLAYDASSTFSDTLSNAIAPFEWRDARPFTPAYLSGFYADTSDIDSSYYEEDARTLVTQEICRNMEADAVCRRYQLSESFPESMTPNKVQRELAMLPVWFLAFRKADRVSYAVVNGQTGKVAGDLPIDTKQFFKWSFLWAIPMFLLLVLLLNLRASTLLVLTVFLAIIACMIAVSQKKEIRAKENYADDKGMWYPVTPKRGWRIRIHLGDDVIYALIAIAAVIVLAPIEIALESRGIEVDADVLSGLLCLGVGALVVFSGLFRHKTKLVEKQVYNLTVRDFLDTLKKSGAGILISVLILLMKPQTDVMYYLTAMVTMVLVIWDIVGIIRQHNLLVTRPLPQFGRRGGEADGK